MTGCPAKASGFLLLLCVLCLAACSQNGTVTDSRIIQDTAAPPTASLTPVLNDEYPSAVHALLDKAQKSVRMVHLYINADTAGDEIVKRLAAAAKRGIAIHVLLEDTVDNNLKRVPELKALGIEAKLDAANRTTHAKLVVVDGQRALLGSTNISYSSMYKNNEANLLVTDAVLAGFFQSYAEALWKDPYASTKLTPVSTSAGKTLADAEYPGHATEMIKGAKKRIMLIVYGMKVNYSYPDSDIFALIKLMGEAVKRGVTVRVILEQADYTTSINSVNVEAAKELKKYGITVRMDPLSQISHAKVLVADDEVIVCSNNWGHGGFALYHEVGLRTRDASVVKKMASYYDGIWSKSTAAP